MGECHHAPSPRRALGTLRKPSHNVLNKLSQRRRFTQKRTMAGVQLPDVPLSSAVGDEQILSERRKRLILFGMNVHTVTIVSRICVVDWSRRRIERDNRLAVYLVGGFASQRLGHVGIEGFLRVNHADEPSLFLLEHELRTRQFRRAEEDGRTSGDCQGA